MVVNNKPNKKISHILLNQHLTTVITACVKWSLHVRQ